MENISIKSVQVLFLLFIISYVSCSSSMCKDVPAKKEYYSEPDSLWSRNIYIQSISNDGNWVACGEIYDGKEGAIVLLSTGDTVSFRMRGGNYLSFSNDNNWFGNISADYDLVLFNLKNHARQVWHDIYRFNFSCEGDHFAAIRSGQGTEKSLMIVKLKDSTTNEIGGVSDYQWHPENGIIAAILADSNSSRLILYDVLTQRQNILYGNENSKYSLLQWSGSGNAIIFLEKTGDKQRLHCYNLNDSVKSSMDADPEGSLTVSGLMIRNLSVSDDGGTVFYSWVMDFGNQKKESMEVWNAGDPWIYPRAKAYNLYVRLYQFNAWYTQQGEVHEVTDNETPSVQFNSNFNHALVYNQHDYEPQYKQYTDADLYLKNIRTGEKHLIVRKQYTCPGFVTFSPKGRYIAYFKNGDWWVFDSDNRKVVNLTGDLVIGFRDEEDWPKEDKEPYGNPGWTDDEKHIILYDRYDIWLITPDGNFRQKLTNGREKKIRYRISRYAKRNDRKYLDLLSNYTGIGFNPEQGIILEMEGDDLQTGYALWNYGNEVKTLVYGPGKADEVLMSEDRERIVFKICKFNISPAVFTLNLINDESRILFQSNSGLMNFDPGRDERLNIRDLKNGSLSGVLIYPAHFDPEKKYPMIVHIYEKNSGRINYFSPPSEYESDGFNILSYAMNGYFVLLPDLEYTIGKPGISALRSVTGLVRKVLRYEYIDKSKIGLIGHSFGGYEAAFIATQTDMFRAVVAGAPVTDLVSWYHDIQGNGWDTEQMWRLENHQFRMGGSLYDMKRRYYRNSPLQNIEKLHTPLLLWAGKNDYNINWYQSIYLFMAMKRLGKEGKLVLFNDEGHTVENPVNQEKLYGEIYSWFNNYLKEERSE